MKRFTANEIKRLRQYVRYYRWFPILLGFNVCIQFLSAATAIIRLHSLSARVRVSWDSFSELGFLRQFAITGIYSGAEVRAASLAEDILLHGCGAVLFVGCIFVIRAIHRKNVALLYYIDRDEKN